MRKTWEPAIVFNSSTILLTYRHKRRNETMGLVFLSYSDNYIGALVCMLMLCCRTTQHDNKKQQDKKRHAARLDYQLDIHMRSNSDPTFFHIL